MDKAHIKRDYESDELIVHWDSSKCTHSAKCVKGLPQVFNLQKHPWIDVTGANAHQLVEQINQCPSGALTCSRKEM